MFGEEIRLETGMQFYPRLHRHIEKTLVVAT
jgi:hypothetical protein